MATPEEEAARNKMLVELYAAHRKRMNEIAAQGIEQVQTLTRCHNVSIYLNSLGRDERNLLRSHALELMLKGILGVEI